jgi:hypothetical protein
MAPDRDHIKGSQAAPLPSGVATAIKDAAEQPAEIAKALIFRDRNAFV